MWAARNSRETIIAGSRAAQFGLFPQPQAGPEGFRYRSDIINESEEASLAAQLAELAFAPFNFHGHLALRKVVGFGLRYDPDRREVVAGPPIPPWLSDLRDRTANFTGHRPEALLHVLINEYCPGAGVGWHRDKPQYKDVAGVSLPAPSYMRFRRKSGQTWERCAALLEARSVYMLTGAARQVWEHSIPPLERRRYSITFRTLA